MKYLNKFRVLYQQCAFQIGRLKRAMLFAKSQRRFILSILFLTLLMAAVNAVEPLVMKYIFDSLSAGAALKTVLTGLLILISLGIYKEISTTITNWLTWRTRLNIHNQLLDATVERIHRLPYDLHRKKGVGSIMTRLDRGIQGFIGAINEISFNVLPALAYLFMAIFFMFRLDWRLSVLVLVFTPLPGIIAALASPRQIKREKNLLDRWMRIYSRFNEVLSGIVTVRSFAKEDYEKQRFLHGVNEANQVVIKGVRFDSTITALQSFMTTLARVSAIGYGGMLVLQGQITLGTLIAFLGYVGGLFGPVQGLTGIYRTLRTASVSLDQIFGILDTQDSLGDAPDAIIKNKLYGQITFQNVHFSYQENGRKILENINLAVNPGEVIAIVGPSGSGKTTLMSLLQRFYDPDQGIISIDGTDLRKYKQKFIRTQIGIVLQDALLFNETIRNNIIYGNPTASEEEIIQSAKAANAHNFIMKLEKGYDAVVGEKGSLLSGGERQRIAIARAILKDPSILILDEATSALDAETEFLIQEALERLIVNRTTFIIAHRLSTVVKANRIIVLKDGRIIESGSHRELMKKDGYYASLVFKQTRNLIPA